MRLLVLLAPLVSARGGHAAEAPAPAPKTHTLFMGVDLAVAQEKQFYRVRDVSGGSFVIDVKGRPVFVSMDTRWGAPINLRVDQGLKVSRVSATLANLVGERAYTSGRDPRRLLAEQQIATQLALADKASMAEVHALNVEAGASKSAAILGIETTTTLNAVNPSAWSGNTPYRPNEFQTAQNVNRARDDAMRATGNLGGLGGAGDFAKRLENELAKELYDAMQVDFELTSADPLNNPYVVLITRFHEKNAKPGEGQSWIYAKSLDPVADKPLKVHVLQGGFPPGFVLENFQVHLFNQGREIATNVAPKRVPLSIDEASLYLTIEQTAAHKNDSAPARPVLTTLPADFQARLARGEGRQPLWVRVTKEGRIGEAYLDEEKTTPLADPYLTSVLRGIRCTPAIEQGQPVESVVRLKLTDLPQTM